MQNLTLTYYGRVEQDGTLKLPGAKIRKEVQEFAGKEIELTIRRKRKHRSDPQNRYYWGVVIEMIRGGMRRKMIELKNRVFDPTSGKGGQWVKAYAIVNYVATKEDGAQLSMF